MPASLQCITVRHYHMDMGREVEYIFVLISVWYCGYYYKHVKRVEDQHKQPSYRGNRTQREYYHLVGTAAEIRWY
jgi:hypothetical protein